MSDDGPFWLYILGAIAIIIFITTYIHVILITLAILAITGGLGTYIWKIKQNTIKIGIHKTYLSLALRSVKASLRRAVRVRNNTAGLSAEDRKSAIAAAAAKTNVAVKHFNETRDTLIYLINNNIQTFEAAKQDVLKRASKKSSQRLERAIVKLNDAINKSKTLIDQLRTTNPAHEFKNDVEQTIASNKYQTNTSPVSNKLINTYIIDGSNVCRSYNENEMSLCILLNIANYLMAQGSSVTCIFDANIYYILKESGKLAEAEFYRATLKKHPKLFCEVPGGSRADDFILKRADSCNADIISNDKFNKDTDGFVEKYPWLSAMPSRLHKGKVMAGNIMIPSLDIDIFFVNNIEAMKRKLGALHDVAAT